MCICCVAQHMRCSAVLSKFAAQCQASDHTKISSELFGHLSNIKPCDCSATNCLAISTWGGGVPTVAGDRSKDNLELIHH